MSTVPWERLKKVFINKQNPMERSLVSPYTIIKKKKKTFKMVMVSVINGGIG